MLIFALLWVAFFCSYAICMTSQERSDLIASGIDPDVLISQGIHSKPQSLDEIIAALNQYNHSALIKTDTIDESARQAGNNMMGGIWGINNLMNNIYTGQMMMNGGMMGGMNGIYSDEAFLDELGINTPMSEGMQMGLWGY